jgi:uncharacterized membrane protein YjjP (DUF1212 family)
MQDPTSSAAQLMTDLARAMHSVSLPADVIEEVLRAAASRLGLKLDLIVLQTAVLMEVEAGERRTFEFRRLSGAHWRLEREHELMRLARSLADGSRGLDAGRAELTRIEAHKSLYSGPLVIGAYSLYGSASAARAGGRWLEMLVGALLGVGAGLLQIGAAHHPRLALQKSFLAGLLGALGTLALALVLPPFAAAPALYGGILLFVPAMSTTTAMHELASGAVESGSARLLHAFLVFALLMTGIAAAGAVWTLFGPLPSMAPPHAFPVFVVLAILVAGTFGLMGVLEVRLRDAAWVVAAVLLAWGLEQLTKVAVPERGSPLAAAFALAVIAYPCTRKFGRSPTLMLVPGLLQLTPGFVGTATMLHLLGDKGAPADTPLRVIMVAAQITLGLVIAHLAIRPRATASH